MSRSRSRTRSRSPGGAGMDIDKPRADGESLNPDAKVVIVQNLTRNVVEAHLQTIFSFYGPINKIDLPVYAKSGQNRGKAAIEFLEPAYAHKAYTHMNGGQLDGAVLKLELSDLPVRSRSPHPPPAARRPPRRRSFSRSRSRSPLRRGARGARFGRAPPPPPPRARDSYRPALGRRRYTSRSYSRSRSPVRRGPGLPPRRRSPSYSRGGMGRGRGRTRSRSTVRSSRSRSFSYSRSRSRSRSRSYSRSYSYSRSPSPVRARSFSRGRSRSRGRRSYSRDDIRDSRSRSPL